MVVSQQFKIIQKQLQGGKNRRKNKKKKLKLGGRVQDDGRGGITLKKKASKNISLASVRAGKKKRRGGPIGDITLKGKKGKGGIFAPGTKIRITGHENPELNGKIAIVDKWLKKKNKYGLQIKSTGKRIALAKEYVSAAKRKAPRETSAKKPASKLKGMFAKKISLGDGEPAAAAASSSGARITFTGGQIKLNKKGKDGKKRKQAGGLAAAALKAAGKQPAAKKQKVAKTHAVVKKAEKKKPKKKKPKKPVKKGLGPEINNYRAKGGALVLIRNLPKTVAGHHLIMDLFPDSGEILSSIVHTDQAGKSAGSGEVHFARVRDATKAIGEHKGTVYGGNRIFMTLVGTQQGKGMTSGVAIDKEEVESSDYESDYEDAPDAAPTEAEEPEEHKEEPAGSQSGGEPEPEEEEDEEEDDNEEAEASGSESGAGEGELCYISPSDEEEDEGPEFHVTLKGGLSLPS